jgi:hypothetical protein
MRQAALFTMLAAAVMTGCDSEATPKKVPKPLKVTSDEGGFSAIFPIRPRLHTSLYGSAAGNVQAQYATAALEHSVFEVIYVDFPPEFEIATEADMDKVLDDECAYNVGQGTKEKSRRKIKQKGYPGREVTFSDFHFMVHGEAFHQFRVFLVNRRLYVVRMLGSPDEMAGELAQNFIKSFKILAEPAPGS